MRAGLTLVPYSLTGESEAVAVGNVGVSGEHSPPCNVAGCALQLAAASVTPALLSPPCCALQCHSSHGRAHARLPAAARHPLAASHHACMHACMHACRTSCSPHVSVAPAAPPHVSVAPAALPPFTVCCRPARHPCGAGGPREAAGGH